MYSIIIICYTHVIVYGSGTHCAAVKMCRSQYTNSVYENQAFFSTKKHTLDSLLFKKQKSSNDGQCDQCILCFRSEVILELKTQISKYTHLQNAKHV